MIKTTNSYNTTLRVSSCVSNLTQQNSSVTSLSLCFCSHKEKCDALQELYYLNICTVTVWKTVHACNCMSRGVPVFKVALSIEELIKHHMRQENIHKQLVN
jgi:hypothetical protein